jgi:hypothetical protein
MNMSKDRKPVLHGALSRLYREILVRAPQPLAAHLSYLRVHGRLPNLAHPRRLTEHFFVQKMRGDHWAFAKRSDKVLVKEIVAQILGPEFITPTLWHGPTLPPRQKRNWPLPFVLKANHGSGMNALIRSEADLDWSRLEALADTWLRTDWPRWQAEDWYNMIDRQLLVEPLLGDGQGSLPDYKVLVFFGQAKLIQVDTDRNTPNHTRGYYDLNWKRQSFWVHIPLTAGLHPRPDHLNDMVRAAEKLSCGFDFVRVDFYELPDGPRFGEMTFSPSGGLDYIGPRGADLELGQLWEQCRLAARITYRGGLGI